MLVYKVSVLNTIFDSFDYTYTDLSIPSGCRVLVDFRNKPKIGIIIGVGEQEKKNITIKPILNIIDQTPIIPAEILNLCLWVSKYYQAPIPAVLALAIPKKYRQGAHVSLPTSDFYSLKTPLNEDCKNTLKKSKSQLKILEFIAAHDLPVSKKTLLNAGFTSLQLSRLVENNFLTKDELLLLPESNTQNITKPLELNKEQELAVNTICNSLDTYNCFLLKGVTGSGKTEVYLQVIAKVLENNQQVLILVPEIGLTPQLLARFSSRFKECMLVMHSNLNDTQRQQAWQFAHDNHAKLIIGTRTAIFTPMPNLKLIIIDEEHDLSLKQMDGVRYFAKDTALMRAYKQNIPIILGSATPSLESMYNCINKKYTLLELNHKALNSAPLEYTILDIRNLNLEHGLAHPTVSLIEKHLKFNNQVLVFINRRGYSPVLLCNMCKSVIDCPNCDAHLTLHTTVNKLICHHCGLTKEKLNVCPSCNGASLVPVGIGTQRVYEHLSHLFPTTSILRIDRDETYKKNALESHLNRIHSGDAQLIVGTQMLAKGHHFPNLTLVVVLDTDNGFYNQDFRALERLGQLLTQVAGRAGRAQNPGQVLIQTSLPKDPLLNILIQEGYESFAGLLLEARQKALLPPYSFLAILRAQAKSQEKLLEFMHKAKKQLQEHNIIVLGPAPAPLARKSGLFRMQLMLKSSSRKKLNHALSTLKVLLANNKIASNLNFSIDVDPMDLS
jgi:primosomal protein N' (replication factor Y)